MTTWQYTMGLPAPAAPGSADDLSWSERWDGAPCTSTDADVFFPGSGTGRVRAERAAKKVCAECPLDLKAACLDLAMKAEGDTMTASRFGIFGGLTAAERAQLAAANRTVAS